MRGGLGMNACQPRAFRHKGMHCEARHGRGRAQCRPRRSRCLHSLPSPLPRWECTGTQRKGRQWERRQACQRRLCNAWHRGCRRRGPAEVGRADPRGRRPSHSRCRQTAPRQSRRSQSVAWLSRVARVPMPALHIATRGGRGTAVPTLALRHARTACQRGQWQAWRRRCARRVKLSMVFEPCSPGAKSTFLTAELWRLDASRWTCIPPFGAGVSVLGRLVGVSCCLDLFCARVGLLSDVPRTCVHACRSCPGLCQPCHTRPRRVHGHERARERKRAHESAGGAQESAGKRGGRAGVCAGALGGRV